MNHAHRCTKCGELYFHAKSDIEENHDCAKHYISLCDPCYQKIVDDDVNRLVVA